MESGNQHVDHLGGATPFTADTMPPLCSYQMVESGPGGGQLGRGRPPRSFHLRDTLRGTRPIYHVVPTAVTLGQTVFRPNARRQQHIARVHIGPIVGGVTHTFNQGQRFNSLAFSQTADGLNVTLPSSANLAPLGHYMLFILNSSGVPSVAKIIRVDAAQAPAAPSNLTATAASSTQINLTWTDNASSEDGFKIERCQGAAARPSRRLRRWLPV